jgi:hypothetical protein
VRRDLLPGAGAAGGPLDRLERLPDGEGVTVMGSTLILVARDIAVDVAYAFLDPLVRY